MKKIFIKALLITLLSTIGSMGYSMRTNAASQSELAKTAYNTMLSKSTLTWNGVNGGNGNKYSTKNMKFSLIDLDNNKTPELIVHCGDTFGYEGVERVYTYEKNKIRCIFVSGNSCIVKKVYPSGKFFIETGKRMGTISKYYQVYENGEVTQKAGEWVSDYGQKKYTYFLDNKTVTKSVYTTAIKKLSKGAAAKNIKLYSNTKANRNKYLSVSKPFIKMTSTKKTFTVGDSYTFKASKKNTSAKITWSVSNKSMASINKTTGKFKALKSGKLTIYASAGKVKTSIDIQINKKISKWNKDIYLDFMKNIKDAPKVWAAYSVNQDQGDVGEHFIEVYTDYMPLSRMRYATVDLNKDNVQELVLQMGNRIHIYTQKKQAKTGKMYISHVASSLASRISYDGFKYPEMFYDKKSGLIGIDSIMGFEATREYVTFELDKNYNKLHSNHYWKCAGECFYRKNEKSISKASFYKSVNQYFTKANRLSFQKLL